MTSILSKKTFDSDLLETGQQVLEEMIRREMLRVALLPDVINNEVLTFLPILIDPVLAA